LLKVSGGIFAAHVVDDEKLALTEFFASGVGLEAGPFSGGVATGGIAVAAKEFSERLLAGGIARIGFGFTREQGFGRR